ncbi:hypothetical protein DUI87_29106 [Hirundo rustica rustica]|uniref:Uncharacterized protein n=1 Tax=Hirundo rustica rustica TaxID=333673 RepID=A0A3M0J0F7_HIRRU|nr:hypothetical protein DUI87_29106 [Hirundo rustica rustica]
METFSIISDEEGECQAGNRMGRENLGVVDEKYWGRGREEIWEEKKGIGKGRGEEKREAIVTAASLFEDEFHRRCSNSSLESDDEPPCAEEIDYDTASSSDGEEEFLELDQEIQECLSCVEGETEDEGVARGQTCSSRALRGLYISSQPAPNSTALPLGSTALGLYTGFESSPV